MTRRPHNGAQETLCGICCRHDEEATGVAIPGLLRSSHITMRMQLLESVIAASLDAIVCADEKSHIILWNKASEVMFGYSETEAIGQPLTILLCEEDKKAHLNGVRHFLKTGKPHRMIGHVTETQGLRKDASTFPVEISLAAKRVDGQWLFTAIMRNISGRRQSEEALAREQAHLNTLLDVSCQLNTSLDISVITRTLVESAASLTNSKFGTAGMVEDGRMIFREYLHGDQWIAVDYTFEPGYGVPGHVMQTKKPYISNDAEHDAHVIPEIIQALDFHQLIDIPILNRSGELLGCFEIHDPADARPFNDADIKLLEGLAASAAVALDNATLIAKRKQIEDELKQQVEAVEEARRSMLFMLEDLNVTSAKIEKAKKEWEATFDAITDPVFMHDKRGNITRANRAYARQAGMDMHDFIGLPYWQVFPRMDVPMQSCLHAWKTKTVKEENEELQMPDGRILLSHSYAVWDEKGEYGYSIHFIQDITERRKASEKLRKSLEGTIQAIASALEARDPYTAGHEQRVAELACAIGKAMGFGAERIKGIRLGGMVHDIGKIRMPAELLSKPARLTKNEYALMKEHPQVGYDILKSIEFPWPVADITHQHHERIDGSGYPQGLKNDDICLEARIVAVADVVEAMASHRPYRAGLGIEKALGEISRGRGKQYDADVVDACLKLFREKKFSF